MLIGMEIPEDANLGQYEVTWQQVTRKKQL